MKHYKIILFAFLMLAFCPKPIWAQVNNKIVDSTDDDDSAIVDPDYKPLTKSGNTVNGRWYGIGNVMTTNQTNSYLCELLLNEKKKGSVTGYFNYFFRDGYFSNKLYGTYDKTTQTFTFKPVIVLFHQTVKADIGVDVPMYGNFILNLNSKDTTLTGFLTPVSNYKYMVPALNVKLSIIGKGEPVLKERIRRRKLELEEDADVATVMNQSKADSAKNIATGAKAKNIPASENNFKNDIAKTQDTKKQYANDTVRKKVVSTTTGASGVRNIVTTQTAKGNDVLHFNDSANRKRYANDTLHFNDHVAAGKGRDTLRFQDNKRNYQNDTLRFQQQVASVNQAVEAEFKRRSTNLYKTLEVKDDSVTVSLYDNGEFDHDQVSVFYNGKQIASNVELKTNIAAKFIVHLDTTPGAKNELTLFAENLGTIPPNSALMIIEDAHGSRYEVNLSSDLSHNASVLLQPVLQ
ncbi:MAG: hypothetical protein QM610_10915 [Chitinophagaceae bacterium]